MNSIPSVFRALGVATFLLALSILGAAQAQQAQMAAPAAIPAQSTFCGSQPLCYETADFAATITDFRTSTSGGLKLIDVDVLPFGCSLHGQSTVRFAQIWNLPHM